MKIWMDWMKVNICENGVNLDMTTHRDVRKSSTYYADPRYLPKSRLMMVLNTGAILFVR